MYSFDAMEIRVIGSNLFYLGLIFVLIIFNFIFKSGFFNSLNGCCPRF
jgi:hypothetical protein